MSPHLAYIEMSEVTTVTGKCAISPYLSYKKNKNWLKRGGEGRRGEAMGEDGEMEREEIEKRNGK